MDDFEITLRTLNLMKSFIPKIADEDDCPAAVDFREYSKSLDMVIKEVEKEIENQRVHEIHSEITIEMEQGGYIPLVEWARMNGVDESFARAKARRGGYHTAKKTGRDWFINEFEKNSDNRKRKCSKEKN